MLDSLSSEIKFMRISLIINIEKIRKAIFFCKKSN
ncbi:MAG: hypothetical protein ACI85O_002966, partial [Saprospiraceae bacterium]